VPRIERDPGDGGMVKLSELPAHFRDGYLNMELPRFDVTPWVDGPPLAARRVAVISTAGLHLRDDPPFADYDPSYRIIPGDADMNDLVMSHLSTNFDRTGFYRDVNTVLPIDRLRELVADGTVGSLAGRHFSFMGAAPPGAMEPLARDLAGVLKSDAVDAVLLCPV
jgi:D-proline reductase (dithiol) PrdB